MARRARRKQSGVIGTLALELSALAGILGIAQPAVRDNMWSIVNPTGAANAPLTSLGYPPQTMPQVSHSQYCPFSYSTAGVYQPAPEIPTPRDPYQRFFQPPAPPNTYTSAPGVYQAVPANQHTFPNYTAQATLPTNPVKRPLWQASVFSPMGGYQ